MLQREAIEAVMMELAHQQGQSLNGRDRLAIRTGVAQTIQAKERHRRRVTAPTYQWTKPAPKRRCEDNRNGQILSEALKSAAVYRYRSP